MSALSLASPFPIFTDIDGNPLEDGYIYVGTAGLNPETNPIQAYWDAALTVPAAQPIRTLGGYPSRNGAAARIYVNSDDCSMLVKNKNGILIFSALNQTQSTPAGVIGFIQSGTGAVLRTAQDKMRESVSVKDFGAAGDGAADDTAALQAALDSGSKHIYIPDGTYLVSATLDVPDSVTLEGSSPSAAQIKLDSGAANGTNVLSIGQYVVLQNFWIRGNWDGVTAGLLGIGIYAKDTVAGYIHGMTLENVAVDRCKSYGIYVYEGAYIRWNNVLSDTHGLDAVYLEGVSAGSFTSTEISGQSIFSSCPNGYGLRLKNCHSSRYSFISEYTLGVAFEGDHRALMFDSCYFETSAGGQNYIFNALSGGAYGITIQNCFLGMTPAIAVIQGDANYQHGVLINNSNLTTKPYLTAQWKNWTILNAGEVTRAKGTDCVVNASYVTVGNVGVGEDTLFTYTLPGGTLYRDGTAVRIRAWGKTANNANGKNVKLYFGSANIFLTGAVVATDKDWVLDAMIVRSGASDQRFSVSGIYNATAVVNCSSTTENLANDVIIKITGEASADSDILQQGWVIELLDTQSLTF